MSFTEFKSRVQKDNNKNFYFVKIRKSRTCCNCLKTQEIGVECLTINPKRGSRRWMCQDCVIKHLNLSNAKAYKEALAFDDEGGYLAALEWEAECEADLLDSLG